MEIDDDDDFGDLYTDVLRPLSISTSAPNPSQDPLTLTGGDRIPTENPSPDRPLETLATLSEEDAKEDWMPDNWNVEDDDNVPVPVKEKVEPRVSTEGVEARVSISIGKDEGARVSEAEEIKIGDLDQEPVIPGLTDAPLTNFGNLRVSNADDDWDNDSDSEDDLQIVLNDNHHLSMGAIVDDDDDGEEDLVIVTDSDQQHHHHVGMEEQDWDVGEMQLAATDADRKEGSEAAKVNGAAGIVAGGPRMGYSHGFHPQHHSMYKYVRPGVAAPGAPPGQIHPPLTIGSFGGRGRGDWRPAGRGFHPGFGPSWSNNASRSFGSGLDFNLPSHTTIFDVDIEGFEEKPWRQPTVDISDYFNFGLDEIKWKEYCKQLGQLRLESTMQGKIRVYESGRSRQEYDPDLPPELAAAAAGHHDIFVDNLNHGKIDNAQTDLSGQERGLPFARAPFPPGRAIQVETGSGERLPSIDTRPPRNRDADAIIEIVCQDLMEDSTVHTTATEQPEKDTHGEQLNDARAAEGDRRSESEYNDGFPQTFSGHQREMGSIRIPYATERRLPDGVTLGRHCSTSVKHSKYSIPIQSAQDKKHVNHPKERPSSSMQTPELSPRIALEPSAEQKDGEHDDMLALSDCIEVEGEVEGEGNSDIRISGKTLGDESIAYSSKKQKLSSQVEQSAIQDHVAADDDTRATRSDTSKAKSGSSNQKMCESGEEEVQGGRSRRTGDMRMHHEEQEYPLQRKNNYVRDGRHEMERMRMASRGREAMNHSYPHRDFEPYPLLRGRSEGFERPREMASPFWQRREDETHSRRIKDEDIRRDYPMETGSRDRSKVRISDNRGGPRGSKRDEGLSRSENSDDHQGKRIKEKEHSRRERTEKEDSLHGYRDKQDSSRQHRERDDNPELRRREGSSRMRDKTEDHRSSKHREEIWQQREREDRQVLKHSHEDSLLHRGIRSGRAIEVKSLHGSARNKSDSKLSASDKDYQHKDKRRHGEQSKRGNQCEEENDSQHKGYVDGHSREKHSRNKRLSAHGGRPSSSDDLRMSKEIHREITRKNKDTEATTLGKRKTDDSAQRNEKSSSKSKHELESNNSRVNQMLPSSEKQGEPAIASDDETQHKSKRGRSKLERWTSNKERDYGVIDNLHLSSSRAKEIEGIGNDVELIEELPIIEGNNDRDQTADKSGDDRDRHMDTVEKLKRRSERFKLPMPGEKEVALSKRSENDAQLITQNEAPPADNEVKPERPARKRRWTSS